MKHWQSLKQLLELYGVDDLKGGGRWFYDLVMAAQALRYTSGYTARDYAAGFRREAKLSAIVYASCMKRACWALFDASEQELAEIGLRSFGGVYDLAEAIVDALPDKLDEYEKAYGEAVAKKLQQLGISPSR